MGGKRRIFVESRGDACGPIDEGRAAAPAAITNKREKCYCYDQQHKQVRFKPEITKKTHQDKQIIAVRAIMIKHMGDLWAAQVARRPEADDSEVMEDLKLQWNDVRKFTPRMPT